MFILVWVGGDCKESVECKYDPLYGKRGNCVNGKCNVLGAIF